MDGEGETGQRIVRGFYGTCREGNPGSVRPLSSADRSCLEGVSKRISPDPGVIRGKSGKGGIFNASQEKNWEWRNGGDKEEKIRQRDRKGKSAGVRADAADALADLYVLLSSDVRSDHRVPGLCAGSGVFGRD